MAVKLQGYLDIATTEGARKLLPLAGFELSEGYNMGWRGTLVFGATTSSAAHSGNMMAGLMATGVIPGASAVLRIVLRSDDPDSDGTVVRSWPVALGDLRPHTLPRAADLACSLRVMDPISALATRTVWAAYRACSIAEMIGGALSVAAGGSGKPTLNPRLPNLPPVNIIPVHRQSLHWMHYGIAAGATLSDWLVEVLGRLGLRLEMIGRHDGTVQVRLCDSPASGAVLPMAVAGTASADAEGDDAGVAGGTVEDPGSGDSGDESAVTNYGSIGIVGLHAQAGVSWRSSVIDNPEQGGFRRVGLGSVGNLFSGLGIDPDEAARRAIAPVLGTFAEMFIVSAMSRQPAFRPGRVVVLDHPLRALTDWQIAIVHHSVTGDVYGNTSTLLNAAAAWLPDRPPDRPNIVVPGTVDGGEELSPWEPVPRDRLGRISVSFPFVPAPTEAEVELLAEFDTNNDGRIRVEDFDNPSRFDDTEAWEAKEEQYRAGEYDDPYGDREDLTAAEDANRAELAADRAEVLEYLAYRQAKAHDDADYDRDGHVTRRDAAMSEDLREAMANPLQRAAFAKSPGQDPAFSESSIEQAGEPIPQAVQDEYDRLFGDTAGEDESDLATRQARLDAEVVAEKWPPRLPLGIVQPMAGGLHGFVTAHRQGDACRVVVHHPFWAEVAGFQYRDDRPLNESIMGATAGIVVEHDMGNVWSGMVFRPTEAVEFSEGEGKDESESDEDGTSDGDSSGGTGGESGGGESDGGESDQVGFS